MAASDDEAGLSNDPIRLDANEPIMDVRTMNKLFPKIDNLEHFPLKVLMNIFTRLDYMDLFNLAEESSRFERIAKIVFKERYSHEYFVIDEYELNKKEYIEFLERFGSVIQAINVREVKMTYGEDVWIKPLLDAMENLQKITLERIPSSCYGILENLNKAITHLILHGGGEYDFVPSRFRNLKKLEIKNSPAVLFAKLPELFHCNPALDSLVLGEQSAKQAISCFGISYPFGWLMEQIGTHLKHLKELEYTPRNVNTFVDNMYLTALQMEFGQTPDAVIEKFVSSLKHLESLGLSSHVELYTDFKELLRRLSSECKSIKHLKLYDIDGDDTELFDIIRSFENIESLALAFTEFTDGKEIESLVERLRFLRKLDVVMLTEVDEWPFVLVLLRKCKTLEKLTVTGDPDDDEMEIFGTSKFLNDFVESIQNPNVKLEIKLKGQSVGSISKDEVIWRNKLVYWVGYDPDLNSSDKILLDLAKIQSNAATNAAQSSPFDLILGYLDLKSLCSLSQTSKKCCELVENHVKQRSQQQGTFTITNEFRSDYDGLEMFAEYVTNLKVEILNWHVDELQELFGDFYNLIKMNIYSEIIISPHDVVVPQVRHLIFDGPNFNRHSQLYSLSELCPNLETFELKQGLCRHFEIAKERLQFVNLKRFKITYLFERFVDDLRYIFDGTNTEFECISKF